MAAKSKNLPGHKWWVFTEVTVGESNFFLYKCRARGLTTHNGEPLPAPFDTKCEKPSQ